jgi:hypothetical protein
MIVDRVSSPLTLLRLEDFLLYKRSESIVHLGSLACTLGSLDERRRW